jgi:hypothetical protein
MMSIRLRMAIFLSCLLLPALGTTQSIPGDVTFVVPLNLTQLYLDITKIAVDCSITSNAIDPALVGVQNALVKQIEFPVAAGRLVTTASIVVSIPPGALIDPIGKVANYQCRLSGYSVGTKKPRQAGGFPAGWDNFEANHVNPSFRLAPTPALITGSFVW